VPSLEKNATIQPAIADFIYLFYYHPFYFKDSENPIVNSDYNPFVLKCDHDENLIKIGLVIGSAVVNYQMSLLEWERNLILDEIDLNSRMEHVGGISRTSIEFVLQNFIPRIALIDPVQHLSRSRNFNIKSVPKNCLCEGICSKN